MAAGQVMAHPCDTLGCLEALVVGVYDGDTVTVAGEFAGAREQKRLRLTEIDSPERGQPWGDRARQAMADKVFQRQVRIAPQGEDRYGRLLGRIYVGDRDINREMIQEGHAWVYRQYSSDISLFEDESLARERRAGLWSLPVAERMPPWERRQRGDRPAQTEVDAAPADE